MGSLFTICLESLMINVRIFTLWVVAACLPGCTYTIHPILTEADMTEDIDLSGTWQQEVTDPKDGAIILRCEGYADNTSYDVTFSEKEFTLEIGKLGSDRYLQFIRTEIPPETPPILTALPVYGFAKFEIHGDALHVFKVDDNRCHKLLLDKNVPFKHYRPTEMVEFFVLTQTTSELQSLLRESGDQIFSEKPMVFRRLKKIPDDPSSAEIETKP